MNHPTRTRLARVVGLLAALVIGLLSLATPTATAAIVPDAVNVVVEPGTRLEPGTVITTPNGRTALAMQSDGNMVLYRDGRATFHTGTYGHPGAFALMQADGNLVVYGAEGALWHSGTFDNPGTVLAVQGDGNLVLYAPGGRVLAVWPTPAPSLENPHPPAVGPNGGWTPRAAWLRDTIKAQFGMRCTTYATSSGDHATGNALDCWGTRQQMYDLSRWAAGHAGSLKVQYVIFEQRIWNISRASEGWRLMADRGNPTQNHFDHVHISMQH